MGCSEIGRNSGSIDDVGMPTGPWTGKDRAMTGSTLWLRGHARRACLSCAAAVLAFLATCESPYAQHSSLDTEGSYPHLDLARLPTLNVAYALYLDGEYDGSIEELNRFIEYYPVHEHTDYAHYLGAVNYYRLISGRDAGKTRRAMTALEYFLRDYPDSQYAEDAFAKARAVEEILAADHLSIGRFYQDQGALLGAIKRFQIVVREYPETTQSPEAARRLVESFTALGFRDIRPEALRAHSAPATAVELAAAHLEAARLVLENGPESAELSVQVANIVPEVQVTNFDSDESDQPFFAIHLSSVRNEKGAKPEWWRLQKRFPDLLENWELLVRSVELEERGIHYRVLAGPFTDYAKAQEACEIFKSRHQYCLARGLAGDQSNAPGGSG